MSLLNSINSVTTTMNTTTNHLLNLLLVLLLNKIYSIHTSFMAHHPAINTLLSTYNKVTPPYPENKGVIFLYLSLTPICFELTEEGDLEGTVWYHWKWEDSRLKWIDDTSNEVLVPKRLIHIPGILPISKYVRETFDHRELATIYRNGTVFLNQRVRIKVPCDGYTWDNPWDIMNCSFTYTPWTHNSATIDLRKLGETDSVDLSN
ncbi:5-hydroxytryptamine receptor 3B isoform X2 [Lepeophtheirus salmonis]|uniref:5-hydroxytryptamine receptor 3B isoform X2 n=1 Tax=Lepeophtheirus salmonis TaxID=72036 RepID=UPI001AE19838|nr:neuronal acetylcholine receptor subunit alpha-4-like isoform X2 [Lepeophtheirus salmonis]